jgi:hypothetical protein
VTEHVDIDESPIAVRIEHLAGDFSDLVADGKHHLGCRVVAEFGFVDFQPQALGALAAGEDFGFGEVAHDAALIEPVLAIGYETGESQLIRNNKEVNTMTMLKQMTDFWDDHINGWLDGNDELPESMDKWFRSYSGRGHGQVKPKGMPEPWIGDLSSPDHARMVVLGLNPGDYIECLQKRNGTYSEQVRKLGSYTKWAATNPYLRDPWKGKKDSAKNVFGINRYHANRLTFARRWLGERDIRESVVVLMELYPWHSKSITGVMKPEKEIIRRYVLDPISELTNVTDIFAFGKPWKNLIHELLGTEPEKFGKDKEQGEKDYGSLVPSRKVHVYSLTPGKRIIVEWHSGSAGPPSEQETDLLEKALG